MRAAACVAKLKVPMRLTAITRAKSPGSCACPSRSTLLAAGAIPAQATAIRATPCAASARASASATAPASVTSAAQ